jgi:hypothetical protein
LINFNQIPQKSPRVSEGFIKSFWQVCLFANRCRRNSYRDACGSPIHAETMFI